MDRLWSPWRSAHVTRWAERSPDERASVFEQILAEDDDERNLVVWRGVHVFVLLNLYPYNNGHCMIVPNRRIADYSDLTDEERVEMSEALDHCLRWIRAALRPDGFNVGMNLGRSGGAGIPDHLHMHVVPRWSSDTNFMPTIAETKVIPEAMSDTYRRIRKAVIADGMESS